MSTKRRSSHSKKVSPIFGLAKSKERQERGPTDRDLRGAEPGDGHISGLSGLQRENQY